MVKPCNLVKGKSRKKNPNPFYNISPHSWTSMVLPKSNNIHSYRWNSWGEKSSLDTSLSTLCLATSPQFLKTKVISTFLQDTHPFAALPGYVPPGTLEGPAFLSHCTCNCWLMFQVAETGPDDLCVPDDCNKSLLNEWMSECGGKECWEIQR